MEYTFGELMTLLNSDKIYPHKLLGFWGIFLWFVKVFIMFLLLVFHCDVIKLLWLWLLPLLSLFHCTTWLWINTSAIIFKSQKKKNSCKFLSNKYFLFTPKIYIYIYILKWDLLNRIINEPNYFWTPRA